MFVTSLFHCHYSLFRCGLQDALSCYLDHDHYVDVDDSMPAGK